jgi:hypothetical protein
VAGALLLRKKSRAAPRRAPIARTRRNFRRR